MDFKSWIRETAIKAIKTMAQTALGVIGTTAIISEVNWVFVASAAGLSGIVCVLMNIANLETNKESDE